MNRSVPRRRAHKDRRGFALVTVLWFIVAATSLTSAILLTLRQSVAAARNRSNLTIAEWRAEDCVEHTRAAVSDLLVSANSTATPNSNVWRLLDRSIERSPYAASLPCTVALVPAGVTLDLNGADREDLNRLFAFIGIGELTRDSLADAALDWRDADDTPRAHGVERAWYLANQRLSPRDGPFGSVAELQHVRGFEQWRGLDSLVSVDRGRIVLDRAPLAVVASLPGMTEESVLEISERRARGQSVADLASIASQLSPASRRVLESSYAELAQRVTNDPDAWIVRATARAGVPAVESVLEVRLVRAGTRAAVMRRRSWP